MSDFLRGLGGDTTAQRSAAPFKKSAPEVKTPEMKYERLDRALTLFLKTFFLVGGGIVVCLILAAIVGGFDGGNDGSNGLSKARYSPDDVKHLPYVEAPIKRRPIDTSSTPTGGDYIDKYLDAQSHGDMVAACIYMQLAIDALRKEHDYKAAIVERARNERCRGPAF